MKTIPAQEIKRRGIAAVDKALAESGAVHVIRNNRPSYVVISEERYGELVEAEESLLRDQIRESLADYRAGRVRKVSAQKLIDEYGLEEE